jgi:hypothetical protein
MIALKQIELTDRQINLLIQSLKKELSEQAKKSMQEKYSIDQREESINNCEIIRGTIAMLKDILFSNPKFSQKMLNVDTNEYMTVTTDKNGLFVAYK